MAFASDATNLIAGDTNGTRDIFVHQHKPGVTVRVSIDSAGNEGNGTDRGPSISANGRFVAFDSDATNLVPGDTNGVFDIFLHDRNKGVTTRLSVDTAGAEGNGDSFDPAISGNGRFIAYESNASDLVAGDTNNERDTFVRDRGD